MTKLFDLVDKAYYLNLNHRADRRIEFENHFYEMGLLSNVERISAIHPLDLIQARTGRKFSKQDYANAKVYEIGTHCAWLSHCEAIKRAKALGLQNVLVFEDDARFCRLDGENIIVKAIKQLEAFPEWEILYLGSAPLPAIPDRRYDWVSPNLVRVAEIFGVHAVLYRSSTFDAFISDVTTYDIENLPAMPPDTYLNGRFKNKYMVYPLAVIQSCSTYSDISQSQVSWNVADWIEASSVPERALNKMF